jgi:hypothetical protein
MTEELSEDVSIQLSPERLLAAILKNIGEVELSVEDVIADYTQFEIEVTQEKDDFVIFKLVERSFDDAS